MAMTKPKSSQIEHRGESVQKVLDGLTQHSGNISTDPEWSDVPSRSDPAFDVQTQALANRTEVLRKNQLMAPLVYKRVADARAAASELPSGQLIDAQDEGKRYRVEDGSLVELEKTRVDAVDSALFKTASDPIGLATAIGKTNAVTLNADLGQELTYPVHTTVNVGFGRVIRNSSPGALLRNVTLRLTRNASRVEEMRLSSGDVEKPAILLERPDAATEPPYSIRIDNVTVNNGSAGVDVKSAELYCSNLRVTNPGNNPGAYGVRQVDGLDTTLFGTYTEHCKIGLESWRHITAYDSHLVASETALKMQQSSPNGGSAAKMFGIYCDTPKNIGMDINRANGTYYGVDIWNVGKLNEFNEQTGIKLGAYAKNNAFYGIYINGDGDYASRVGTYIDFDPNAVNNLLININGRYKLRDEDKVAIRNQTVFGCTGGWARHNNVPRKSRARAANVAAGGSASLVFKLDFSYPERDYNFFMFKGNWAVRCGTDSTGGFGEMTVFVASQTFGMNQYINKLAGPSALNLSIESVTLSGDELTVVIKNNYTGLLNIAVEIERSVDPAFASV